MSKLKLTVCRQTACSAWPKRAVRRAKLTAFCQTACSAWPKARNTPASSVHACTAHHRHKARIRMERKAHCVHMRTSEAACLPFFLGPLVGCLRVAVSSDAFKRFRGLPSARTKKRHCLCVHTHLLFQAAHALASEACRLSVPQLHIAFVHTHPLARSTHHALGLALT